MTFCSRWGLARLIAAHRGLADADALIDHGSSRYSGVGSNDQARSKYHGTTPIGVHYLILNFSTPTLN